MAKFTKFKVGQIYNGFRVISIDEIGPFNSDGILFMHEKTGMQIFHMLNEDAENLFYWSRSAYSPGRLRK